MYVCNCHGITENELQEALSGGARQWDHVHAFFDCEPCCGKCECEISEAIADHCGGCKGCDDAGGDPAFLFPAAPAAMAAVG